MQTLYISQQGCTLSLQQNRVLVKHQDELLDDAQLPLLEQILIFGRSHATTPLIQACLKRQIPIVYLSQTGQCYGRLLPLEKRFPKVIRAQHLLEEPERLAIAQQMVWAKLKNCRVLLMRQRRRLETDGLDGAIDSLNALADQALSADSREQEFRAPMVDSLVLYLVNRGMVDADTDFVWTDDGCYLNQQGRKTFLQMFIQRMSEMIQVGSDWQPRWYYLTQQVKEYARCMGDPTVLYSPYLIR